MVDQEAEAQQNPENESDEDPRFQDIVQRKAEAFPTPSVELRKLDPLRRYLLEISRFEPLSAEEEKRLAILYQEEGDQHAAYRLVTSNLSQVVKIAMIYNRVYSNVLDLIQEGNIGLMKAVKRFDPYRGNRLPTYASWWIKAYIIKFLLDNFRIVRVGTTNEKRRLLFNLRKEKEKLRLQGIEPTAGLIAERLDVSEDVVRELAPNIEGSDLSLDAPVGDSENSARFVDSLPDAEEMIDDQLARGELKELFERKLEEFSKTLNERERDILRNRLIAEEPATLREISERYGVTREAIRLNEKSLVAKIKDFMSEELKGVTDVEFGLLR